MTDADKPGAPQPKRSLLDRLRGRKEPAEAIVQTSASIGESDLVAPVSPEPAPQAAPAPAAPQIAPKLSWWTRLRLGLSRSSQAIGGGISDIFSKRKLDADTLQDLEDVLIRADLSKDLQPSSRQPKDHP